MYIITRSEARKIRKRMKRHKKNVTIYNRLKAVALRGEGKTNKEISEIVELHEKRISQLASLYAKEGLDALAKDGRKGGNRRNLSLAEEAELLEEFRTDAINGQIITVGEIKKKYDAKVGHESGSGTIYKLLRRHNWRQVMPRSKHPNKASDEEINSSKKLKLR